MRRTQASGFAWSSASNPRVAASTKRARFGATQHRSDCWNSTRVDAELYAYPPSTANAQCPLPLVAGIDDTGTGTSISQGWAYCVIALQDLAEFHQQTQALLAKTKLPAFHGKDFARRFAPQYADFLKLARQFVAKHPDGFLACTLLSERWKIRYKAFCDRLARQSLETAGIDDTAASDIASKLAPPLFTLQRFAAEASPDLLIEIEIDSDAVLRQLSGLNVTANGHSVESVRLLRAQYQAYRTQQFPGCPALREGGIRVVEDSASVLVQAADVFGNFSTAFAFEALGKSSNTTKLKADAFRTAFGDIVDPAALKGNVFIVEEDLQLTADGSLTLRIG